MRGTDLEGRRHAWRGLRHSLGARLVTVFVLLALFMTFTFVAGMQAALRFGWGEYVRPLVADYADTLVAQIGTPPDIAKAEALTRRLPLRIRITGPVVNWSSHPGEFGDGRSTGRHTAPGAARDEADHPALDSHRPRDTWRPTRLLADGHRITFGMAFAPHDTTATSDGSIDSEPEDRPRRIGWITLGVLLLLTALAYALVRHWLRPLRDIGAGAERYGRGDFSQPIARRHDDELGSLAGQINAMAGSLHHMRDAQRQLLLAISHELRSPLTRARLNAELVAEGTARDALLHDLAEMRDLITDLLESERLENGHAALQLEESDLNALVGEMTTGPSADGVELTLDDSLPEIPLDRTRIKLLLRNLLDNALRHGAPGEAGSSATQPPQVRTWLDKSEGALHITVRDRGPGVDDAQLPHLAEAFYRADSARQRATGGVGLGLHLCRLVAQAHGGRLILRNAHPGLEAELILPIAYLRMLSSATGAI